ncbi:conserved virulence factor C family protein [Staphylococcus carnosus]|uniref:conserved virulence factor C family protein n=1 Tax=Staphylococcus carnosus TaxID=1281 RepID=UPI0020A27476|nr:conserved virulence factor C family protein [Staphylococcus carnosus]UTB80705.1 virulence factor [Staphylococcus carnosus]
MEIVRIEPTPSPNTMKVVLNKQREDNQSSTYTAVKEGQPEFINHLLDLEGVKSIFYVIDFLAIDKTPKADWEEVLPKITAVLNEDAGAGKTDEPVPDEHYGEIKAEVLVFKGIPYQIKLSTTEKEERKQLPAKFVDTMLDAQKDDDNVVFMRKWEDLGTRYGDIDEVMSEVEEEIIALYPTEKLDELLKEALQTEIVVPSTQYKHVTLDEFNQAEDWKAQLRMLKSFPTPTKDDYPFLEAALNHPKVPIRREAVVLASMVDDESVLPYLYQGLNDKNPGVRRTAGDGLSDLGYKDALPEMEKALDDPQKIVRWRAAMFIFDEGGEAQLPALKAHENDDAYEVKLQIQMAISRIENGDEALGSVWKQIANRNK